MVEKQRILVGAELAAAGSTILALLNLVREAAREIGDQGPHVTALELLQVQAKLLVAGLADIAVGTCRNQKEYERLQVVADALVQAMDQRIKHGECDLPGCKCGASKTPDPDTVDNAKPATLH